MVPDSGPRSGKNAPKKGTARKRVSAGGRERQKFVAAKPRKNTGKEGAGRNMASAQPSRAGSRASGRGR